MFHNFAHLPSPICQTPISPGRIGQTVEHKQTVTIKVYPTQVRDQIGHPVFYDASTYSTVYMCCNSSQSIHIRFSQLLSHPFHCKGEASGSYNERRLGRPLARVRVRSASGVKRHELISTWGFPVEMQPPSNSLLSSAKTIGRNAVDIQGVPSDRRLGLVDLDFDCSLSAQLFQGKNRNQLGNWQKWLGSWAKW